MNSIGEKQSVSRDIGSRVSWTSCERTVHLLSGIFIFDGNDARRLESMIDSISEPAVCFSTMRHTRKKNATQPPLCGELNEKGQRVDIVPGPVGVWKQNCGSRTESQRSHAGTQPAA